MAMSPFCGEWILDRNENYGEFLKAAGMNVIKRTMATKVGGTLTITDKGGNRVNLLNVNGPQRTEKEFPLDEEVDDEDLDGLPAKTKITIQDGKLITTFVSKKGKNLTVTRYLDNGTLVQIMNIDGTECKRFYKRKQK